MLKSSIEKLLLPRLIHIENNLYVAKFELMKLLPAYHVVQCALDSHLINPDIPIVETSSGTFALGLAKVCHMWGLSFHIIGDSAIDQVFEKKLIRYGGKVQLLSDIITKNSPQECRLTALKAYLDENPQAFWTRQYDNPQHKEAYRTFADMLASHFDRPITLVSATGSGGSACGTITALREYHPDHRLVGVDTFGSVLFGLANKPRALRGLGNSILPKNLDHRCFDEVHWVSANDAYCSTLNLFSSTSLFCGPTTGATYKVAQWVAKKNTDQPVVFVSADTGCRYQNSLYNTAWRNKVNLVENQVSSPVEINHPDNIDETWSSINWQRRSLAAMLSRKEVAIAG